jgi:hypothetical protein
MSTKPKAKKVPLTKLSPAERAAKLLQKKPWCFTCAEPSGFTVQAREIKKLMEAA